MNWLRRLRSHRLARRLLIAIATPAAVVALAVIATNLWLWLGGLKNAGLAQQFEYARAWMLVPGTVHLKDVTVRGRIQETAYAFGAPNLTVDLELWPALTGRWHVERLKTSGAELRLAQPAESELRRNAMPDVSGLGLRDGVTTDHAELHLRVDTLNASFNRVWILGYNYSGKATATGGLTFEDGSLSLDQLSLAFDGGSLHYGATIPISDNLKATLQASTRPDKSNIFWNRLDGKIEVHGRVRSLRFLTAYSKPAWGVEIDRGAGRLSALLSMKEGSLRPQSSVEYQTDALAFTHLGIQAQGPLSAALSVRDGRVYLRTSQDDLHVNVAAASVRQFFQSAVARRVTLTLHASHRLAPEDRDWRGRLAIPKVHLPELALLNVLRHPEAPFHLVAGKAELSAQFDFGTGRQLKADVETTATSARMTLHDRWVMGGDAQAGFELHSASGSLREGELKQLRLQLQKAYLEDRDRDQRISDWHMTLKSDHMRYGGVLPYRFAGPFETTLDNAGPVFIALDLLERPLGARFRVPSVQVEGYLWHVKGSWDVLVQRFEAGNVEAQARIRFSSGQKTVVTRIGPHDFKLGLVIDAGVVERQRRASLQWLRQKTRAHFPEYPIHGVSW